MSNQKSKRYTESLKLFNPDELHDLPNAIKILKSFPEVKFDQTVEISFLLGVDVRKVDQKIRTSIVLPKGTGKTVRILVFAEGEEASQAEALNVDHCGSKEYIDKVKSGWLDFDVVIATPEMMREVGKLGKVLGPRGLMPSPKDGTVTKDVEGIVKQVRSGRVDLVTDKLSGIHARVGKISFSEKDLQENIEAVCKAIVKVKPTATKGTYIKAMAISATMTPGVKINRDIILGLGV